MRLDKRKQSFYKAASFPIKDTNWNLDNHLALTDRKDGDTEISEIFYTLIYHPYEGLYGGGFGKFIEIPRAHIRDILE